MYMDKRGLSSVCRVTTTRTHTAAVCSERSYFTRAWSEKVLRSLSGTNCINATLIKMPSSCFLPSRGQKARVVPAPPSRPGLTEQTGVRLFHVRVSEISEVAGCFSKMGFFEDWISISRHCWLHIYIVFFFFFLLQHELGGKTQKQIYNWFIQCVCINLSSD